MSDTEKLDAETERLLHWVAMGGLATERDTMKALDKLRARIRELVSGTEEIAPAWQRGEAAGLARAAEWLRSHGYQDAAKALDDIR